MPEMGPIKRGASKLVRRDAVGKFSEKSMGGSRIGAKLQMEDAKTLIDVSLDAYIILFLYLFLFHIITFFF